MTDTSAPRPKSVLLFQVAAVLIALAFAIGVIRAGLGFAQSLRPADPLAFAFWGARQLAVIGTLATAVILVHKRKPAGRIVGLVCLAGMFGAVAWTQFIQAPSPSDALATLPYEGQSGVGEITEYVTGALMLLALAYWFHAFGFGSRARSYFGTAPCP